MPVPEPHHGVTGRPASDAATGERPTALRALTAPKTLAAPAAPKTLAAPAAPTVRSALGLAAAALSLALVVTGCTMAGAGNGGDPSGSASAGASATATGEPSDDATDEPSDGDSDDGGDPELDADGTAEDNIEYFDFVNKNLVRENDDLGGRDFIDHLVDSGFEKSDMEVTPDKTAIDLEADTIEFSVRMGDTCLLGQMGGFGYRSSVVPVMSTNKCLIGETRDIDW